MEQARNVVYIYIFILNAFRPVLKGIIIQRLRVTGGAAITRLLLLGASARATSVYRVTDASAWRRANKQGWEENMSLANYSAGFAFVSKSGHVRYRARSTYQTRKENKQGSKRPEG